MRHQLAISCLEYKNRLYKFWKPVIFTIEKIDENTDQNVLNNIKQTSDSYTWICYNHEIGIFSFSENFGDILNELCEDFDSFYREIVLEMDEKLDRKAKIVKQKILNLLA